MAIMWLQTHIIHWRKLGKFHREMFSKTNYMKEDSRVSTQFFKKILRTFAGHFQDKTKSLQDYRTKMRL